MNKKSNKKLKLIKLIIILAIFIIAVFIIWYFYSGFIGNVIMNLKLGKNIPNANVPVIITKENFYIYISAQNLVKDLPKDGKILLKFYNFNSGERQLEESYLITRGNAERSNDENVDAIITLNSKYLNELNNLGFCGVLAKANKNGELGSELKIGTASFMWKYNGVLKYKSCIGM